MTQGLLRIYVEDKDGNAVSFPLNKEQAVVKDWTRTAERMAGAPSVTGTVMHRICLDNLWTKKEFVVIGGERYYVKQVPTSSKDTEDVRYKHDVTLVSERDILENVYFFDVVTKRADAQVNDKPRSNTTDFSFTGDLKELVERLNDSLSYSKIYDAKGVNGFCIVIDDDVEIGEAQEVSITDAYFATAMQEIYNVFKVPYYWVGRICHVGYAQNEIEKPFEYGKDNGLLSVSKNNSEYRLINRITGMGSADNIPYYYPNNDPNGTAIFTTENFDKSLISQISLAKVFQYTTNIYGLTLTLCKNKQEVYSANLLEFDNYATKVKDAKFVNQKGDFTLDGVSVDIAPNVNGLTYRGFYGNYSYKEEMSGRPGSYVTKNIGTSYMWCYLVYDMNAIGKYSKIDFSKIQFVAKINKAYKGSGSDSAITTSVPSVSFSYDYAYYIGGLTTPVSKEDVMDKIKDSLDGKEWNNQMFFGASIEGLNSYTNSSSRECDFILSQKHCILIECCVTCNFGTANGVILDVSIEPQGELDFIYNVGEQMFIALPSGKTKPISESGITITNTTGIPFATVDYKFDGENWLATDLVSTSTNSAKIVISDRDYITPMSKLMPYVYREQKGAERFYNALNNKYLKENGEYYSFSNPYLPNEPLEGKQDFEDIKPTINGITNAQGQFFGEVADIAFDETDSDDLAIEEGDSNTAKLVHSYFYIKLHRFNGDYGFNLFKQGLSKGAMTLNFITGSCAGCAFEVHVADEKKQVGNHYEFTNLVQVDESGNIVDGDFNDKIKNNKIDSQQDTVNNEVWVALLKDQSTFGVVMPNVTNNYRPKAGDKFVITNILLPQAYITAAEKRLEAALIKYMSENNDEKFTFSIKFSRIYLQKHIEDIVPYLNENAKINVRYNKTVYPLYVSSYTQKYDGNILDEISVELSEELTITQNKTKQQMDSIMGNVNEQINSALKGNSGNQNQNNTSFDSSSLQSLLNNKLSRKTDDTAAGLITFLKGLVADGLITAKQGVEFGEFISGYIGKGGRIDANGHGELESLTLRSFLAVPVLRYNRVSVTDGESWNTNGFGVIEEVDTENKIITLHLEDDEYASVEQGDICRGIFQDLDSEYSTADADADDCGFATKKGFFTSYFTVVRLISSGKGECRFEYALRNESTPQPCRMMKFAQYGSFTNEQRMSSCYSSAIVHFYSQVMEHVNTWEISPMMVSLRFGWLEGFPVTLKNGNVVRLKDHGLYVPGNVYFGQTITQLDAASIADLKKQLEQYTIEVATAVDVITVDDAGNVIGGLYSLDADGKKTDYRLSSAVFVKRGNEYLTEADKGADASSGTYRIYAYCDGCECVVDNSTIYITSIKNIKDGIAGTEDDYTFDYDAMRKMTGLTVTVVADCEGIGSISKDYHVTVKHDPKPFINFVMDNQIANISYNTKTQKYVGSPYKIRVSAYKDNAKLPIVAMNGDAEVRIMSVKLSSYEGLGSYGISYSWDKENNDIVLNVSVSSSNAASGKLLFTASYTYAGVSYEQSMVHSINIASDTNMYELMPSVSQVVAKTNQSGELVADTEKITCKVICNSSDDGQYVMTADELTTRKMSVKYSVGDDATLSECPADGLSVLAEWSKIVFHLFFGDVEIDTQDVPVMLNGVDGSGVEYVFLLTTEDKEPTIYDDSNTEAFQAPDYCPYTDEAHTRQWTDEPTGIGINNRYEWVAQRKKQYGKWLAFSKATKWATYSIDGTSPYSLDLTNESSQVLCDQDGNVIGDYETTAIQLYHGASVMSISDFNITITATNISYSLSGAVITPSAFASGKDSAQIAVKAELKTNTSVVLTAVYSITKNKAGKDGVIYSLQPSVSTFSKDSNGVWVTKSFYLYAKKTTGAGATEITTLAALEAEGLTLKYGSTTVTSSTLELVPSAICGNNAYADLYLYKGSVVIDRERINVVSDGEKGEDGEGVEYIYKLTTGNVQPAVPATPDPIDTDVKGGWTDNPQGVSAEYPYEWVSEHTKSGGTWGAYTPATIWAKWSFDGSSITSVSEYYHANNDGKNAPDKKHDVWWNNPTDAGFGADNPYLWNYEVMHYSSGSSTETDPAVISVWSQDGRGIKNITEYYLATTESSGVTFNPSELGSWTTTVQTVTPTNKYLWNVECVEYTDEKNEYTDPVIIGVYGDKGDPGRGILFTERQYNVGNSPVTNPSADDANWSKQSPETTDAKPYLWKRYKYHYTNSEVDAEWTYEYVGMKGERGIDGGGTEWIYHHTSVFITDDEWDDVNKYWSDNPQNWPSSNNDEYKQSPWTDDPQGVTEEYPYEWISQRKKSGGVWGSFTKPTLWAKWSKDGSEGKNGKYSKVFYTWTKDEKPTAPTETGISVNDSRITWCDTSERGLSYSFTGGGWISVNNGEYRKEPGISAGNTTYENISIRATKPNQKVFIEIGIERPSIGDEIYITSDSVELASARGNQTAIAEMFLAEAKDGYMATVTYSRIDNTDSPRSCWYRILTDENLKCWACNAVVDGDNDTIISWGDVVMYTCDTNKQESIYILSDCEDNDIPIPTSNAYKDKYVPRLITNIWSIDAQYSIGARVLLEYNGVWRRYKCKKSVPDIKPKDENSNYWVQYSGTPESHTEWSIEGLYSEGDYVLYNGHYYQCIKTIPNIRPYATESEFWTDARDWTDDPTGISEAFKFEYVSIRQKNNGVWGSYSKPVIWTKWAMDAEAVKGDPGYSLNPPVFYQAGTKYVFERLAGTDVVVRDVVIYPIEGAYYYFMVKNRTDDSEDKVTSVPGKEGNNDWQQGSKYELLIADALIAANANIGGFRISGKKLISADYDPDKGTLDNVNLVLDGVNGTIKAKKAEIEGKIVANSGSFDNCTVNETCQITKINATSGTIGGFNIYSGSIGTVENTESAKKNGVQINANDLTYADGTHEVTITPQYLRTYNSYVEILSAVADSQGYVLSVPYGKTFLFKLRLDPDNIPKSPNGLDKGDVYVDNGVLKMKT